MANLSEILQMSNSQILSNILYPIEYSYGSTEVPTGYPTFSIAYLIYSTSHHVVVKCFFSRVSKKWCCLQLYL